MARKLCCVEAAILDNISRVLVQGGHSGEGRKIYKLRLSHLENKKIGLILCINAVPAFYHWLKMLLKVFKPKMARAIHLKSLFYEGF